MQTSPTVIVVDTSQNRWNERRAVAPSTPSDWLFDSLLTQVHRAGETGLPIALVASSHTLRAIQGHVGAMRITLASHDQVGQEGLAGALRIGVQACSTSPGWILLPSDVPMLNPATLSELSALLGQHPVTYVTHRGGVNLPMGFAPELFSELMRIHTNRELMRLVNRYPSRALEVPEPDLRPRESGLVDAPLPHLHRHSNALKG